MIRHTEPDPDDVATCREQVVARITHYGGWASRSEVGHAFSHLSRHALTGDLRALVRAGVLERQVEGETVEGERYPRAYYRVRGGQLI